MSILEQAGAARADKTGDLAARGPGIVCLHANASSSRQWRGLAEALAGRCAVEAPDLYDSGEGPHWPSDRVITLSDEAALIEPALARAGPRPVLVGHSYGAAVAVIAALAAPGRVRALALYEPVLFSLLDAEQPGPNAADGIRRTVEEASMALDAGWVDAAAGAFIDYWMGAGAWAHTPEPRKPAIRAAIVNIRRWGHALSTEPTPLCAIATLNMPILLMSGGRTTPAARGVMRLLTGALPHARVVEFAELGHMGPVTHPAVVNAEIGAFVAGLA